MMTPLQQLCALGQSPWYDSIRRSFLTSGRLQALIESGVRGVTVNPTIFEQAILDSTDYDTAINDLLARGETLGVFQLDGGPMRALLKAMAPTCFEDIAAVLALYRPGPRAANAHIDYADRKNGRKPATPIHAELAEPLSDILDETYGLIVYQEQVMAIAQRVAGYSLAAADLLRRAMGKKKKEILDKEYAGFAQGMKDNGYSAAAVKTLWDILLPFSDYAFNRAHSAAYGVVSYWTAYLKANYPAEYMSGVLTSVRDDKDKAALYLSECRRMGITVLAPDVKWHATGRSQGAGDFDGLDATLGNFLNLAQLTNGTFSVEVHDVLATDDHAVVLATSRGERNGKKLESSYCHVFHFNDKGQASECWVVPVDPYAGDDFFA